MPAVEGRVNCAGRSCTARTSWLIRSCSWANGDHVDRARIMRIEQLAALVLSSALLLATAPRRQQ
jgi:hypothetical protein